MVLKRFKEYKSIYFYIFLASIPIIIFILIMAKGMIGLKRYRQFLVYLDQSMIYAMESNSLMAEYDNISMHVSPDNSELLYEIFLKGEYYHYNEFIFTDETILFDFGSGDKMWIAPEESSAKSTELVVYYVKADEATYTYLTKEEFYYSEIIELVLSEDNDLIKNPINKQ